MTKHEILKKYLLGLVKGYNNSLIIVSRAGTGKTETTLKSMKELGLIEGQNFRYLTTYTTPVELFLLLDDINHLAEPRILIIDDAEAILQDKKIIGILKSALWETPNGERKVCWNSGTYKIKNKEIEFTGRIILLLNEIKRKSAIIRALADRGFFYEMKFTKPELLSLMRARIKIDFKDISYRQKQKIIELLEKKDDISLRDLPQSINLFRLSPNHYRELILTK